ncbi:MAG: isochorismatase family protein [Nitrospira sp.]|jgi:nicotinamidase/pyrazinamidase|nr:isochorismatase family protein [Nitrospira sp.]MBP6605005.1 isochorismatase family protein [Nitrospira sp.]MCI1279660.1 isochorismatase family protein [Nitrospira sp.]HQY58453.1 isochorismatase family protein [Nitrospira sp.]
MKRFQPGDALIIVDVQNDLLPGGALAVPGGQEVIPPLQRYLLLFIERGLPVFLTQNWHPPDHCSFHTQGGPWPQHCIAHTPGAQFPDSLQLPPTAVVISKGTDPTREAYSGFQGTALHDRLQAARIVRLFIGGLATDYCVLETVRDARTLGYEVCLLVDAIRPVNVLPDDGRRAEEAMVLAGAIPLSLERLAR